MTKEQLDRLEKLYNDTTPEWLFQLDDEEDEDGLYEVLAQHTRHKGLPTFFAHVGFIDDKCDAMFIVEAHNLMPQLIARVRELESLIPEKVEAICSDILYIMESRGRGDPTPGGLEHMGDVFTKLSKWHELILKKEQRDD